MTISAEEEVPSVEAPTGNRQSKQIFLVPHLATASAYPANYFSNSQYNLPSMLPKQTPLIRRKPIQKQIAEELSWPYTYPLMSSPGNQSITAITLRLSKMINELNIFILIRIAIQRT